MFGDRAARVGHQIIVQTVEEYARSSGNARLLHLLARLRHEEDETPTPQASTSQRPVLSDRERDFASILSVLDRLGRPAGTADLGKYRRRCLGYPPRDPSSGFKNRLEEVLAKMVEEKVIVARPTRQGALRYSPGPNADAYRSDDDE